MKYMVIASLLLLINLLYSAYALRTSKEYTKAISELRNLKEKQIKLKAKIESIVNYQTAKEYAKGRGFVPVDWGKVNIVESKK